MNRSELFDLSGAPGVAARVAIKVKETPSGCWEWVGARNANGYGLINVQRRSLLAHRVAYAVLVGPFERRLYVCHRCDNPPCVNPAHLFTGTQFDNMADAGQKGHLAHPKLRGEAHKKAHTSDAEVAEARALYATGMWIKAALARKYGVSQSTVDRWIRGTHRGVAA